MVKVLCELRAEIDKGALLTGASPLFTAAEYGHVEAGETRRGAEARLSTVSARFLPGAETLRLLPGVGLWMFVHVQAACGLILCMQRRKSCEFT